MYRLDVRATLSPVHRAVHRLVPHSPSETLLTVLFLSFLLLVLSVLLKYNPLSSTPRPHPKRSQEAPSRPQSTPASPVEESKPKLAGKPRTIFGVFKAMLAEPLVARPVPVPDVTLISDRPLEVPAAKLEKAESQWPVKQPCDAFLVLDVEATCQEGTDFNWPNEIIEWPVVLMKWRHKDKQGRAKELVQVDEFRSFVKPSWRPELTPFCTGLTGISQDDVDKAPTFPKVLDDFKEFLVRNGLLDSVTGERLQKYTWCSDGPFDIRDFCVKQCFISKVAMPEWLKGDVLDVRKTVMHYMDLQESTKQKRPPGRLAVNKTGGLVPKRRSLNIPQQLRALSLPAFVGRQHSGIDDTRNIARIVVELAKRGIRLEPNTAIHPGRRWQWMGKPGQVLEEYCFI